MIIAESYGAIYERNAINAGMPILQADLVTTDIQDGEEIKVDLKTGKIERTKTSEKNPGRAIFLGADGDLSARWVVGLI